MKKFLSLWYLRFLYFWRCRKIVKAEKQNFNCRQKTRRIKRQFEKVKNELGLVRA